MDELIEFRNHAFAIERKQLVLLLLPMPLLYAELLPLFPVTSVALQRRQSYRTFTFETRGCHGRACNLRRRKS